VDKEIVALIIAQNGLGTARAIFTTKALKLDGRALKETDPAKKAKLEKDADKARKLALALGIANDGIMQYQAQTAE
jgi:hypothetical protein